MPLVIKPIAVYEQRYDKELVYLEQTNLTMGDEL